MARVLVTRAEPEAAETAALLAERGHEAIVASLRRIEPEPIEWPVLAPDALIATSRNAFRAITAPPPFADVPMLCVGARTAEAARKAGFGHVEAAEGDAGALLRLVLARVRPGGRIAYLAGEPRRPEIEATLGAGYGLAVFPAYRAVALDMLPETAARALADGNVEVVLHFSIESARAYFALADAAGLGEAARAPVQACLSQAIADALARFRPSGAIRVAPRPEMAALIGLLDPEPPPIGD